MDREPTEHADSDPPGLQLDDLWISPSERSALRVPMLCVGAVRLVWRAASGIYVWSTALQVLTGVSVLVELLVARDLVRRLLAVSGGRVRFGGLVPDLVVLAVVTTCSAFAATASGELQELLGEKVSQYATNQVIEVANAVDLATFERPSFHDRLLRAHLNASVRPYQMAAGLLGFATAAFAVVGIGVALLALQPLFLLLVAVAFVPAWITTTRASRALYDFAVDQTEADRRRQYLFALMGRREEAAELRAFDLGGFLQERHNALFRQKIAVLRRLVKRRLLVGLGGSAATSLLTAGIVAALVAFVTSGRISVASASIAAGAVLLLGSRLSALASSAGTLYESSLFIDDFNGFLRSMPRIRAAEGNQPVPADFSRLRLEKVTFTYPSRQTPSVRDLELTIEQGQVVALVGENGSGKTTVAKLLAGLYRPTSGAVTWDGTDITAFDPAQLRRSSAVIFQDFVKFHMSGTDNVGLGQHEHLGDVARVRAAAEQAGADAFLRGLPEGYQSLLGVQFLGGHELSLGQWQRLALARTFFRDAPLVVLDEPTASLDARAEYELFGDIRKLFVGRTVVFVSHRFSSVRWADRIFVLHAGEIVESGSHEELMALDGRYAELFNLQAAGYLDP